MSSDSISTDEKRLITETRSRNVKLFYQRDRLVQESVDGEIQHVFLANGIALAQLERAHITKILKSDLANSILGVSSESVTYSPYGHFDLQKMVALIGFNGERRDPATQRDLLGAGHRLYDSSIMRFSSADTLSPFGHGGLNAYAYCAGDPINFSDPSGQVYIPNFLRTDRSLLSMTAKEYNKNVFISTRTKYNLLTGDTISDYSFAIPKKPKHSIILPKGTTRRLESIDNKIAKQASKIEKLSQKTGKKVTLDTDEPLNGEKIDAINEMYDFKLKESDTSRINYARDQRNIITEPTRVLNYFQKFGKSSLERTRVRRGLEN